MNTAELVEALRMIPDVVRSVWRLRGTSTAPIATPNGIAELKQVELNGYPQWVLIRAHDVTNPLFLLLHGGPGESSLWLAHHTMTELERHFVCVNWDQRGAGKSLLPGPDPSTMTAEHLYEDTVALIDILLERFGQQKVFVLGHSWGGLLATRLAQRRPDLLHGVILMNPSIDNRRGEDLSYAWALEQARAARDDKAVKTLEQLRGSDTYTKSGKFAERQVLFRYGGVTRTDPMKMAHLMFEAPEYSFADCLRSFSMKALRFSIPLMADELAGIDVTKEIWDLGVPVFFFIGRHDHTVPSELSEELFASLQAPRKERIWFEDSAHTPDLDETAKFQQEVIRIGQQVCSDDTVAAESSTL